MAISEEQRRTMALSMGMPTELLEGLAEKTQESNLSLWLEGLSPEKRVIASHINGLLPLFAFSHLPPRLQEVSKPFHEHALRVASFPHNWETVEALRKLLEAKDCAVRAQGIAAGFTVGR